MSYQRLSRELTGRWVKKLFRSKGSDDQKILLGQVIENSHDNFVTFVENSIAESEATSIYHGDRDLPTLVGANGCCILDMQPGHMYKMPPPDISRLYDHWRDIPVGEAADYNLWGAITLSEIRRGNIKPLWLSIDTTGNEDSALSNLEQCLREGSDKHIDSMTRRVIRWMMGSGHLRGAPELYSDCSLAMAWWFGHFAQKCEEHLHMDGIFDVDRDKILSSFHKIWFPIVEYLAGKLTVIGHPNVLAGVALWAVRNNSGDNSYPITGKQVLQVILGLGELSSWCVLGARPPSEVLKIINERLPASQLVE